MRGLMWLLAALSTIASAQDFRGEITPRTTGGAPGPIALGRFRFRTLAFGREGPDYFPLKSAPVQGREYLAEARIDGIEGVASVRFELTDASGRATQALNFWKASDSSTSGEFEGFVTIPNQAFSAAAVGADRNGAPFRVLLRAPVQPAAGGADEPGLFPAAFPAAELGRLQPAIDALDRKSTRLNSSH